MESVSKGLGKIERLIYKACQERAADPDFRGSPRDWWLPINELYLDVLTPDMDRSDWTRKYDAQQEAFRRAAKSLERKWSIELWYGPAERAKSRLLWGEWPVERGRTYTTWVRLVPSDEERAIEEAAAAHLATQRAAQMPSLADDLGVPDLLTI